MIKNKKKLLEKINYKKYLAQKEIDSKKKRIELPGPVKIILTIPFLLIFCFGLFYLPFITFQIITSKSKDLPADSEAATAKKFQR